MSDGDKIEKEIKEPRAFGVEYIPQAKRVRPKKGEPIFVGLTSEIPPGKAKAVFLDNFKIAVFNVAGEFFAIKDACPHAEYPLSKSVIQGDKVTCSSHNWQFNIKTGECLRGKEDLVVRKFSVEIRPGEEIWVVP